MLVKFWRPVGSCVWSFPAPSWPAAGLDLCFGAHSLAWYAIYAGLVMRDFGDLLGVTPLLHALRGLPGPEDRRAAEFNACLSNARHGSFTCFAVILWLRPVMTLDRLLIAVAITVHMYARWKPSPEDAAYHERRWKEKSNSLSRCY